jgi:beta-glucosidase
VDVANIGPMVGDEIAQLHVGSQGSQVDRPIRELIRFVRVRALSFSLPAAELACYDEIRQQWVVESIRYRVWVGPSARANDLLSVGFQILDTAPQPSASQPAAVLDCLESGF